MGGNNYALDISSSPSLKPTIFYRIDVLACFTDGTITCNNTKSYSFLNGSFCPALTVSSPNPGEFQVDFTNPITTASIGYVVAVFNASTNVQVASFTFPVSVLGSSLSNVFTGLSTGTYYAKITSISQGIYQLTSCGPSSTVSVL